VRNITYAYNLSLNSQWMALLQTVNTVLDHVVFEHNTIIHDQHNWDL